MFRLAYCLTAAMFVCGCVGCRMFEFEDDCPTCDTIPPEMTEQGQFLDQSVVEELTAAKEKNTELKMQVTDLRATTQALTSQIAQLRAERETHQYSVQQANQEVTSTQQELQDATANIQQLREDLNQMLNELEASDSAHRAEIRRLSEKLEDILRQGANPAAVPQQQPQPVIPQAGAWVPPRRVGQ